MSNTPPPRFIPWLRQQRLDNWQQLLIRAHDAIDQAAREAGIDWKLLRQRLPSRGLLLKGSQVPVLDASDRGRCAFVWYLNPDRYGHFWPCLVFMSFRHGGIHQIFHGYRWAWQSFKASPVSSIPEPLAAPPVRLEDKQGQQMREALEARENQRRLERFQSHCRQWHAASPATPEHPLLQKRLCGHLDSALLERLQLRTFLHPRGAGVMVRLQHYDHGHSGFQLLHAAPLDGQGRTQDLVIRQRGMKTGSFVCIHPRPGHQDWPVAICEGVFTALSVALAWPGPIAVALDAGNLPAVRAMVQRNCVFFADNDAWGARNTGLLNARQAARLGDRLLLPHFDPAHAAQRPTDFNDLLRLSGHAELLQQIRQGWPESL